MPPYVVALDVGGTSMKGGVVTADGTVAHTESRPTPRPADAAVAAIRAFVADLMTTEPGTPAGIGIVVPGLVTDDAARYSANIGWRDVPAGAFTPPSAAGVPIRLGHDVRTAGLAESVLGTGRDLSDFLFLPIGTGIAGAMIIQDAPYAGATGWAGEIGHIPVFPGGETCACGQTGCLETYASASAIPRRYTHKTGIPATTAEVIAAAPTDPAAQEVWTDALEALSLALATYTLLLDPAAIIVGGGLSQAGETLLTPLRPRLSSRLTFRPAPPLHTSSLGPHAGMLGAALLAWQASETDTWHPPDVPPPPMVS
ncbi:glucokinase [Thermocatellispora tengchongensis]|uniref:Glucokinase n=1 Tax=Thermocatellispora tengchongensis TaxID=1073253 RepID=A0A840P1U2_9ACTN|nr:ROK family protein [Thermocatellispora tengchongensis]MBB5135244.1 glucokinase [Thermocatellispora tengchongensis]